MKNVLVAAAIMLSVGAASAQTYDEIIASGGIGNISNMERNLATILERHGVSQDCMGNLTVSDAGQINGIINSSDSSTEEKERRVRLILDRKC